MAKSTAGAVREDHYRFQQQPLIIKEVSNHESHPIHPIFALGFVLSLSACAASKKKDAESAAEATPRGPVETFLQGCKTELDTYCKDVTPGDNRLLACIYAH